MVLSYYSIKCRNCWKWSAKQIDNKKRIGDFRFKCPYCRKTTKLKHKKEFGLHNKIIGGYTALQVQKIVAYLNTPREKRDDKNWIGFLLNNEEK